MGKDAAKAAGHKAKAEECLVADDTSFRMANTLPHGENGKKP